MDIGDPKTKLLVSISKIKELNLIVSSLFKSEIADISVWRWLNDVLEDKKDLKGRDENINILDEVYINYFYNLLDLLDNDLLKKILDYTKQINQLLGQQKTLIAKSVSITSPQWQLLGNKLDLTPQGVAEIGEKINSLNTETQSQVIKLFNDLFLVYEPCKVNFQFIMASLLHYQPKETPATFKKFKETLQILKGKDPNDIESNRELQLGIIRYLGQAVSSHDAETGWGAIAVLLNTKFTPENTKGLYNTLFYVSLLYLAFANLDNSSQEQKTELFKQYVWEAIKYKVPVRTILTLLLADQPEVIDYINLSGSLAQNIFQSQQLLYINNQLTVGEFLKQFDEYSQGKYLDKAIHSSYVEKQIQKYQLAPENKDLLLELIYLYTSLHEGSLIDYRGLLSDQDEKYLKYSWAEVVKKDISENETAEIKQYLQLLHRPFRTKMQLINYFRNLDWDKEPYLSRVLILDNIYEELYGQYYGSLVYFDASDNKWHLNNTEGIDLPN